MVRYKVANKVIGLMGAAGVGKTTLAKAICDNASTWTLLNFADYLKSVCCDVFDIQAHLLDEYNEKEKSRDPILIDNYIHRLSSITHLPIKPKGLVATSYRQLMQYVGTDYIRATYPTYWVDRLVADLPKCQHVVVADVRFADEASAIKSCGGTLFAIERDGVSYTGNHLSAMDMSHMADYILYFPNNIEVVSRWAHLYTHSFPAWRHYQSSKIKQFLAEYPTNIPLERLSTIFGCATSDTKYLHFLAESFGLARRVGCVNNCQHTYREGVLGKVCITCKDWSPLSAFSCSSRTVDGYNYVCRSCAVISAQKSANKLRYDTTTFLFNKAQRGAKYRNIPFEITPQDVKDLWELQGGKCKYSRISFTDFGRHAPTLDRIDNNHGYIKDNVAIVTYQVNVAKRMYSLSEFIEMVEHVYLAHKGHQDAKQS